MKLLTFLFGLVIFVACTKTTETTTTTDTLTVETETTDFEPVPSSDDEEVVVELKISHDDNKAEVKTGGYTMFSFTLPDSAEWDFSNEGMGNIRGVFPVSGNLTHKSMSLTITEGMCYYPSDEGTSTEFLDTLVVSDNIRFGRGYFDNRAAGTDGIDEMFDLKYKGNCVRFTWTMNWDLDVTDAERSIEYAKMEAFLKSIIFQVNP